MRLKIILLLLIALLIVWGALGYAYLDLKSVEGRVHDPQGKPIAQAALTVAGRSTLSDNQGRFSLQISRGTYPLVAFADGFQPARQTVRADDFIEKSYAVSVELPPNEFRVTVSASDTRQPLAGAQVTAADGQATATDAQGQFVLREIKTGTQIRVSATGYREATLIYQPDGETRLALTPAITHITVRDESSHQPLSNIHVSAGDQAGVTDAQGQIVFRALSPDSPIVAEARGYAKVQVPYKGESELTLTLKPSTLDLVIRDAATTKPIPDALVLFNGQLLLAGRDGVLHFDAAPVGAQFSVKMPGYALTPFEVKQTGHVELALTPFKAKGLHLYYGMSRKDIIALLERLRGTELNAVVFDVKEGPGEILWDSQTPLAKQIRAYRPRDFTAADMISICRAYNLYCIARLTVFKDSKAALNRPDLALHSLDGAVLQENEAGWLNPAKEEAQAYAIGLAKELAAMGYDEVQFDYIRYPGGHGGVLEFGDAQTRVANIQGFLAKAAEALRPLPTFFSGDVFGLTTASQDEQGIGQILETTAPNFDYISPMMYPSTWRFATDLWGAAFGIKNCSDSYVCPYDVIRYGTVATRKRLEHQATLVRPWLQAYGGANFSLAQYLAQKKGADDADSDGWLFWNNAGVYPEGLFERR